MKKTAAIFISLICCLHFSVRANASFTSLERETNSFNTHFFKKGSTAVHAERKDHPRDVFCRHAILGAASSDQVPFTTVESIVLLTPVEFHPGAYPTRGLHSDKDHFLHLFPSHYFW